MREFDVLVVGGGPGGYPAAIRASQLGYSVGLVEGSLLGGECTNYGCVPTKSLLWNAWIHSVASKMGSGDRLNVLAEARSVSSRVRERVRRLLEGYGVEIIEDRAYRVKPHGLVVSGGEEIGWKRGIVIATGSEPSFPPGLEPDGRRILSHRDLLGLDMLPESLLIVGAGYIGVEFAFAISSLGVQVYLVEIADRPLPSLDRDLGLYARRILRASGVKSWFSSRVAKLESSSDSVNVTVVGRRGEYSVRVDRVLVATGRRPRVSVSGLKDLGVRLGERGEIIVDCGMRAGRGVFAAGDVTGEPMLAHKAFLQARVAAENIAGLNSCYRGEAIPMVVYTNPELVQVGGFTGEDIEVVKVRAELSARSLIEGSGGFVKIAYERGTGIIRGIAMAFHGASEAAGEAALLVSSKTRICDLGDVVHPHPTFSEIIWEAGEAACGRPRHLIK